MVVVGSADVRLRSPRPIASLTVDNYRPPASAPNNFGWVRRTRHSPDTGTLGSVWHCCGPRRRRRVFGLDNVGLEYSVPITVHYADQASYDRRDYAVIEEPFQDLDIESQYWAPHSRRRLSPARQRSGPLQVRPAPHRGHLVG
jgi:hypothetical protein